MSRRIVAITIAIVLATLGTVGGLVLVLSAESRAQDGISNPVTVAVAAERIPAGTTGEKIRKDVVNGRVTDPERLEERARKMLKGRKLTAPEDFDRVLKDWGFVIGHWNEKIDELLVYKRFFPGRNVAGIKAEAAKLAKKLAKLAE